MAVSGSTARVTTLSPNISRTRSRTATSRLLPPDHHHVVHLFDGDPPGRKDRRAAVHARSFNPKAAYDASSAARVSVTVETYVSEPSVESSSSSKGSTSIRRATPPSRDATTRTRTQAALMARSRAFHPVKRRLPRRRVVSQGHPVRRIGHFGRQSISEPTHERSVEIFPAEPRVPRGGHHQKALSRWPPAVQHRGVQRPAPEAVQGHDPSRAIPVRGRHRTVQSLLVHAVRDGGGDGFFE